MSSVAVAHNEAVVMVALELKVAVVLGSRVECVQSHYNYDRSCLLPRLQTE